MYCHKCGSNNKDENRFCSTCGSELLIPTKEEVIEGRQQKDKSFNYALKSLIISLCTCAFSAILGLIILPFSIWGISCGLKSKDLGMGKVGLIINIFNIFLQIFSSFIWLPFVISMFTDLVDSERYINKYICSDYEDTELGDNIIFELNKDKRFELSYEYPDGSGIITGNYRVNKYEVTNDIYEYYLILNADSRVIDNQKIEGDYQTHYKIKIEKDNIELENTISNNKYKCKKAN